MCGFAGYSFFHEAKVFDPALLERISKRLFHRGPDSSGVWSSPDKKVALVARRLIIQDLSSAGDQPMVSSDQSIVIAFNGEIYNYQELRKQLVDHGFKFRSTSDTEVVLNAYKLWGIDCLKLLDGMFACVIFDRKKEELFLIRDRVGIKPLYFSLQGNALSFASEIKALWELPWIVKRFSNTALYHYLTYLAVPAPLTIFEEVYKLPAGFYAKIDASREISFTKWYDYELKDETVMPIHKKSYCMATILDLLRQSVHKRMQADVPVGALLSGGLDSSLLVALMSEQQKNIKTFNISFEDDEQNERTWARKVAKKFGTLHHELILSEQEAFSFFEKMVYHQDEPLGDSVCIPLYFVNKLAHDAGIKVVQIGEGADELFCGYPMYVEYLKLQKYWNLTQHYIPRFAKQGIYYAAKSLYGNINRQDLIKSWADDRPLFWGGVRVFSELWKQEVMQQPLHDAKENSIVQKIYPGLSLKGTSYDLIDYHRNQGKKKNPNLDFYATMTYIELKHRLPELLLTRTDKMSMAASIEARVPFLDYKLIEFMLQVPMKWKYHKKQTKYILKKIAETFLPHEVIYRKKVGFASPITRWFKNGTYFKSYLQDSLRTHSLKEMINIKEVDRMLKQNEHKNKNYAYQLWAIQNLLGLEL